MEHHVEIIEARNDDPSVPTAYHATCGCGWAAESHDADQLRARARSHEQGDHGIPVPASPSPVHAD